MTKSLRRAGWFLALGLIAACVTVNIYFPAATVEKTADQIVSDVYGQAPPAPENAAPETQPSSEASGHRSLAVRLAALAGPAEAQAAEATSVSNAAIRGLKNQLAQNFQELKPFYEKGNVGIGQDGMLVVRNQDGLALPDVARMRRVVAADNQTRTQLYQEVAKALSLQPSQVGQIQEIFARKWIDEAPKGYYVQQGGAWKRK